MAAMCFGILFMGAATLLTALRPSPAAEARNTITSLQHDTEQRLARVHQQQAEQASLAWRRGLAFVAQRHTETDGNTIYCWFWVDPSSPGRTQWYMTSAYHNSDGLPTETPIDRIIPLAHETYLRDACQ